MKCNPKGRTWRRQTWQTSLFENVCTTFFSTPWYVDKEDEAQKIKAAANKFIVLSENTVGGSDARSAPRQRNMLEKLLCPHLDVVLAFLKALYWHLLHSGSWSPIPNLLFCLTRMMCTLEALQGLWLGRRTSIFVVIYKKEHSLTLCMYRSLRWVALTAEGRGIRNLGGKQRGKAICVCHQPKMARVLGDCFSLDQEVSRRGRPCFDYQVLCLYTHRWLPKMLCLKHDNLNKHASS